MLSAGDKDTERLGERAVLLGVELLDWTGPGRALRATVAADDAADLFAVLGVPLTLPGAVLVAAVEETVELDATVSFSSDLLM